MPYRADGTWEAEDASVAPRVNALIASNNPLIQQAKAQGLATANRRGLINSSQAAGAAAGEAYKVATPIAMQDAAQVQQSNTQGVDITAQMARLREQAGFTQRQQDTDAAAQLARLNRQGQISTEQQERGLAADFDRLRYSTDAADQQQARDIAAQMARLNTSGQQQIGQIREQGVVQTGINATQNAAEMARLQASLTNANAQQRVEIEAQMARLREQGSITSGQNAQQFGFQTQLNSQQTAAEMARLQASLAGASEQQAAEIRAQMDRLNVSGNQSVQQIQMQTAAEMARLQASLAGATGQQATEIQAQMARLQYSSAQEMQRLTAQGAISGGLAEQQFNFQTALGQQQAAQEMSRLQTSLAGASAQQATEIQAQMARLQASAGYDIQARQVQGQIDAVSQSTGAAQQQALASLQGNIQGQLQTLSNTQQLQRMGVEFAQQASLQQAETAGALAKITATGDQEMRQLGTQIGAELQRLQISTQAADRNAIAGSVINIFQAEAQMRANLLNNTTMPAAERAAYEQAISQLGNPARAFVNQLYTTNVPSTAPTGLVYNAPPTPTPPPASAVPLPTGLAYTPPAPATAPATGQMSETWANGALSAMGLGSRDNSITTLQGHLAGTLEGTMSADVMARYNEYVAANPQSGGGLAAGMTQPAPAPYVAPYVPPPAPAPAPVPLSNEDWANNALNAMGLGSRDNSYDTLQGWLNGSLEGPLPEATRALYDQYLAANPR